METLGRGRSEKSTALVSKLNELISIQLTCAQIDRTPRIRNKFLSEIKNLPMKLRCPNIYLCCFYDENVSISKESLLLIQLVNFPLQLYFAVISCYIFRYKLFKLLIFVSNNFVPL